MTVKRAFTLIEMMLVVSIVGVLAALGTTAYDRFACRAEETEAKQVLSSFAAVLEHHRAEQGTYELCGVNNATCECYSSWCEALPMPVGRKRFTYGVAPGVTTYLAHASGYRGHVAGSHITMNEKREFIVASVCR